MKVFLAAALSLAAISCTSNKAADPKAEGHEGAMVQQGLFRPEQVAWKDGPASLPAGAKFFVLEGDPAKAGYFAMRIMLPDGYRIPPHWHPGVERITVISGTFHLGMGERFDAAATQTLPAGSYGFMPPGMKHFARAEGQTVVQITTMGPWGITYVNPADNPRKK